MQFSGNFKGQTAISSTFRAQSPLGSKLCSDPLTKLLHLPLLMQGLVKQRDERKSRQDAFSNTARNRKKFVNSFEVSPPPIQERRVEGEASAVAY